MLDKIPIRHIYALEISGACNLESHCTWCTMSKRPRYRKRGLMTRETFERAKIWIKALPPKNVLACHVFGEPLLHPDFDVYASELEKICPITFSTNATYLNESWADRIAKINWEWVSISNWDPPAKERAAGLLIQRGVRIQYPPNEPTHDWAGQSPTGPHGQKLFRGCEFLNTGAAVIRWSGDLASCCVADSAESSIGHIDQDLGTVFVREYEMCKGCHHAI